jgi:hypothetical protein
MQLWWIYFMPLYLRKVRNWACHYISNSRITMTLLTKRALCINWSNWFICNATSMAMTYDSSSQTWTELTKKLQLKREPSFFLKWDLLKSPPKIKISLGINGGGYPLEVSPFSPQTWKRIAPGHHCCVLVFQADSCVLRWTSLCWCSGATLFSFAFFFVLAWTRLPWMETWNDISFVRFSMLMDWGNAPYKFTSHEL